VFGIIFIIVPSVFTARTGEVIAVRRLGVVAETVAPGLHFRFWLINDLIRYDVTVRQISFAFEAYSSDAQNVKGEVSIQYQINADQVVSIAENIGGVFDLEMILSRIMMQEVQNVIAQKRAMELVETRAELSGEIFRTLTTAVSGGVTGSDRQLHVTITAVAMESLEFSQAFEAAVEMRMVAEQAMMQAEFERDRAIVLAEQQREVAVIEAEAVLVKARADGEALKIMQDAWGDLADTVKDAMLRQQFFETWDGILPSVMTGDQMSIIMDGVSINSRY
jgi:regulator of protease activity HflC (stomatin/prohibitin superfamily)